MKILKLTAQNIKNLKAIEITPDGNIVRLTGKNGAGKSAVLDTIFTTLTGKRLEDPIRRGQERAQVDVDMGDFRVHKVWTEKGERLEVVTVDGDTKKSPQTFLNEVIGRLSFDPLEFKHMKQKDQIDLLKELCGLDFTDLADEQTKVYEERTGLNSKIKDALAQLQNMEAPDPKTPDEEMTFKEELAKLNQLKEKRKGYLSITEDKRCKELQIEQNKEFINEALEQIKELENKIKNLDDANAVFLKYQEELVIPPEVTENQIKGAELSLEDIERKNVDIRSAIRYRRLIKSGDKLKKDSDALSQRLERLEQDKATRIASVKFPVDGLSLGDDTVIFDGITFSSLSTGQQIRLSTAIAMKLNPKLKIILVREGSLLDDEGFKELCNMAKDNDYQIWIEEVDESGKVGFYIEDGSINKIDGKSTKKEEEAVVN